MEPSDGTGAPGHPSRREFLRRFGHAAASSTAVAAFGLPTLPAAARPRPPSASAFGSEVPAAWFDLELILVRETAGFSPPVASRAFGYSGVTLYEALVPGMPEHRSLAGVLDGLEATRPPHGRMAWPSVANAAMAAILHLLFPTATAENLAAIVALEEGFAEGFRETVPPGVDRRSVAWGRRVASHVFEWSRTDGGHEGYLSNFPSYTPPTGPGLWIPTPPGFQPTLQPYWGSNRSFAPASGGPCDPGPPLPYSEDPSSSFFAEAFECYRVVNELSPEQEAIARFWSDDPTRTATPPGHSISILTQAVRRRRSRLDVAAEAYAKVGMAVSDAFISCWGTKYRYNLLRPVTYIQRTIDGAWLPLLNTPPFPEYTSGHSVQSAAAAEVMTDLFGSFAFTDHTHDDLGLPPRAFGSFFDAAEEAALSRLYGGIHFQAAITEGLEQGRCLGRAINALPFLR
jgi:PAP2 superfamily protein